MKKKILAIIVATVACICLFAGCDESATFEKAGMSITLTRNFHEKEIVGQTGYYESNTAIVTALKEEFVNLGVPDSYSVSDYTNLILNVNNLTASTYQRQNKDYMYFTYEKTVTGRDFFYLATTHKTDDSFWLIQFACTTNNKDSLTQTFLEWADSVTFDSTTD